MSQDRVIQTDEKVPFLQAIPMALQHLMAMFGATVLVPILTGLDPSLAIMTSGAGTILYLVLTKNKIPSYLGSSFAFIGPIIAVASTKGIPEALGGLVVAGLVYVVVALVIKAVGSQWIAKILPPALVGAVVIVIGLGLAGVAVSMAFPFAEVNGESQFQMQGFIVAMITLISAVIFSSFFKGFLKTIPILLGIVVGYIVSAFMGLIDFTAIGQAAWFGLPTLQYPKFDLGAILIIAPVAIVVIVEHIGHLLVVNEITGKDFTELLPESLAGDGLATSLSALVGGSPSTTYAENLGVMAVTKVYATQVFWYAGAIAFFIGGFCPKLGAVISSIPVPVMGGISLLLFGLIASSGLRMLVDSGIDFSLNRNLIIASVVLVIGIGMETTGVKLPIGDYVVPGMALGTFAGILLNLVLPQEKVHKVEEPIAHDL